LVLTGPGVVAATGGTGGMTRADYEACQTRDEAAFRTAIEAITLKALQSGLANVNYEAAVATEWRRGGLDELIDKRVDLAVAEIRDETSWGQLLRSLASKEKAQELATAVAERVYRSDAIKTAIEGLAIGVGKQVGQSIELATIDAAGPSLQCLQAFIGPRYGATVARVVTRDAGKEFSVDPAKGTAQVSAGSVLMESTGGIAGSAVLMIRRQLSNMAARAGQRLVGAVLGRLVSVVAGGVGVVLIAKDIWDLRHGVLPIISDEMKSPATKELVRQELVRAMSEQIGEHTKEIAAKTSERLIEIWQEFRNAHAKVLEIADRDDAFRAYLNTAKPESLARLDEVVALLLASEGEPGVLKRLANGTLHQAVDGLPDVGMEIARETRSVETALAWQGVAGDALPKVVAHEIHRRAAPANFTKTSLGRIFALDDKLAITRLGGVERSARDVLFELGDADLKALARGLTESELETLARYLTGLTKSASQRVLRAVAHTPAKMQTLASARVRDAVLASADQDAAVAMMLRSGPGIDLSALTNDFDLAYQGKVSPILLWERHPAVIIAGALLSFLLLVMMRNLLFGRRRRA
jgi:hypothetical protein